MCIRVLSVLAALCLLTTAVHADPSAPLLPAVNREQVKQFVRERGRDARELTLGTPAPQSIAPTDLDCTELYHRRIALMRRQVDYGPTDYFSDPRVGASLFIGAVWTPGFYYLPFHALQRFQKEQHRPQQQADIDALRTASAAQRCFEH